MKYRRKGASSPITSWILAFPLVLATFTVGIDSVMLIAQLTVEVLCCILYLFVRKGQSIVIPKSLWIISLLYLLPWIWSASVSIANNYLSQNTLSEVGVSPYGRLLNIGVLTLLLCLSGNEYQRSKDGFLKALLTCYFSSLCILLLFALWQAADWYLGFPVSYPFQTRSHLHSAGDVEFAVTKRITSYAAEPSFLAPFLVQGIILSFIGIKRRVMRYIVSAAFLVILVLTYSPSAYIALIITGVSYLLVRSYKKQWLWVVLLAVICLVGPLLMTSDIDAVRYFLVRLSGYTDSARFNAIAFPLEYMAQNANWGAFLFGFGAKSMGALYEAGYSSIAVFGTTNTVFADLLFECGVLGLLFYIALFALLLIRSLKVVRTQPVPLLLWVNLLVSSLYRGEFASLPFISILMLIFYLSYPKTEGQCECHRHHSGFIK